MGLLNADMAGILVDQALLRACVTVLSDTLDQDCFRFASRISYDPLVLPALRLIHSCMGSAERGQGRSFLAKAFYGNNGQLWSRFVDYASHLLASGPAKYADSVTRDCTLLRGAPLARCVLDIVRTLEAIHFKRGNLPAFMLNGLVEMSLLHWIPAYLKAPCCLAGREAFKFAAGLIM